MTTPDGVTRPSSPKKGRSLSRDFNAEMRAIVDSETADGPYVSAIIADRIVGKLSIADPELLDGWLNLNAVGFVRDLINRRDAGRRTRARFDARRQDFSSAAGRFAAGDNAAMASFLSAVHVVSDGSRKRLADLTASDLEHVANSYERQAKHTTMAAAFLRALQRRIGNETVGDVFSEADLGQMWRSVSGG